jgi:AraC family transcriptional regulator
MSSVPERRSAYQPGAAPLYLGPCGVERRARLLDLSVGVVTASHHLHADAACGLEVRGLSSHFLVVLPYRGLFVWRVRHEDVVGDTNQVLFVTRGEDYRVTGPLPVGYGYLIVAPRLSVLAELLDTSESELPSHPLYRRRCCRASRVLQTFRARFVHWALGVSDIDDLEVSDVVLSLLRPALCAEAPQPTPCGPTTTRLIGRAKEFLEAELANPIRLTDVGRAVGASPTYLTDMFRRVEGASLHQYLTQLRLARALVELPHTPDLTTLALDLGFSSHSHFAAAFRRRFGCTPSRFRDTTRSVEQRDLRAAA